MNRLLRAIFAIVILAGVSPLAKGQNFAKGYDVISYNASIRLDRQHDSLWGVVTMTGRAQRSLGAALQFAYLIQIDSVLINGNPGKLVQVADSDFTWGGYAVGNLSGVPVDSGQLFTITTYYHGKGQTEQQGSMHWGGVSDYDTMMFAMGVGFNAPYTSTTRHWLPCYDKPDDKADSVDLSFQTLAQETTASNGLLVSNTVVGIKRDVHWHVSHPIATYLLTFATGPYVEQNIPNKLGIPFEVYSLRRDSAKVAVDMRVRTADVLAFYDSLFAPYPFEKVGYVVTPIGSMEHQTMISLDGAPSVISGDSASLVKSTGYTTAVHELAHMWWGDRVTCKTFDDAWLNEGFATFCESLSLEHLLGKSAYLDRQRSNISSSKSNSLDSLPLFGAATVDHHTNNYPAAIYNKGAAVLGMLREYLGDSIFIAAVRNYGNAHAYSTATSADLEQAFEQVSGKDLAWFWREWVYNRGYIRDTVTWSATPTAATVTFHQALDKYATNYFRMPIPVHFASKAGQSADRVVWMDSLQTSGETVQLGFAPDTVKIDQAGLVLMTTVKVTQLQSSDVAPQAPDGRSLVAYPNPNNRDVLTCRLMNCNEGAVTFTLIDATGRTIKTWNCPDASLTELLPMRGIPAGTYRLIARLQSGDSLSTSLTIQH